MANKKREDIERKRRSEWRKKEQAAVAKGKKPFYLSKGEIDQHKHAVGELLAQRDSSLSSSSSSSSSSSLFCFQLARSDWRSRRSSNHSRRATSYSRTSPNERSVKLRNRTSNFHGRVVSLTLHLSRCQRRRKGTTSSNNKDRCVGLFQLQNKTKQSEYEPNMNNTNVLQDAPVVEK